MKIPERLSRFFHGTAVVLPLGMLLVVGGVVSAQKVIELPDLSLGVDDDRVEFTEFKEVENTPERIREKEQEALEARLVDPVIDAFIEDDLRYFKTVQARGSDVVSALEQSYHSRIVEVMYLRKEFIKRLVIPLLDLTPEQKSNKTTVVSNYIIKTPKENGMSLTMTSGFSFKERLSIKLDDFPSFTFLPITTFFEGMQSLGEVKVYEIPEIKYVAPGPSRNVTVKVTCTNIKYAPPQQKQRIGGGTSNYIWTQLTGDCEHDFRDNYSENDWEIISSNQDTWIWEITLVDNTEEKGRPAWYTANGPQPIMMMSDPPNPAPLVAYDAHYPCKSGYWNTIVNIGMKLLVRNKHDNQIYSSYEELRNVFNFGDEHIFCKK